MKKLSKILKESIWSDLQDRSSGKTIRKEDDVNLLDAQGFVEYLRNIYKNVDTEFYIFKDLNDIITVPTFETDLGTKSTWFIQYDCNKKEVYIWDHFLNKDDKLFDKIRKKYNVKKYYINRNFTNNFLITPKTGKSSNEFFIEIIDYLLKNTNIFFHRILVKNDKVTESIWSDLQDRSSGEVKRKEDDVDLITDRKIFRDYLKKHYKETDTSGVCEIEVGHYCDRVIVPVCWKPGVDSEIKYLSIEDFASDDRYMILTYNISKFPDIYKLLSDNYRLNILRDLSGKPDTLDIEPKDKSKVTNKFFLEVLDLLLDNIVEPLEPLVEKKTDVNESIWSDLQDRSSGDVIRKEDAFNPEYVDFGPETTVVWAQDALEIDNEIEFQFQDVENFNKNGWRLPTVEEVKQIDFQNCRRSWYRDDDGTPYNWLKLKNGTLRIKSENSLYGCHMWTKDRHERWKQDAYVYGYDNMSKFDIYPSSFSINKHFVFLVKDKKLLKR